MFSSGKGLKVFEHCSLIFFSNDINDVLTVKTSFYSNDFNFKFGFNFKTNFQVSLRIKSSFKEKISFFSTWFLSKNIQNHKRVFWPHLFSLIYLSFFLRTRI